MSARIKVPLWVKKIIRRVRFYLALRAHSARSGNSYYIDPTVHILRLGKIRIGKKSVVSAYCTININNTDKDADGLVIGNYCWIGIRNFFSPGSSLKIGDYVLTGPDCRYLGANHIFEDPMAPYVTTGTDASSHTIIGANVWLGAGVTVLGGVCIGHGSIIGAQSIVTKDIPPFSVAVGAPARIIKRYDPTVKSWIAGSNLSELAEGQLLAEHEYIEALKQRAGDFDLPLRASGISMGNLA